MMNDQIYLLFSEAMTVTSRMLTVIVLSAHVPRIFFFLSEFQAL
jgi:hypothetical protein